MTKGKPTPTPASYTIKLGHPVLIFFWSFWMVLLGVALGEHLHPSHGAAVGISIVCATMIVIHELIDGFIWCSVTALLIGRHQR